MPYSPATAAPASDWIVPVLFFLLGLVAKTLLDHCLRRCLETRRREWRLELRRERWSARENCSQRETLAALLKELMALGQTTGRTLVFRLERATKGQSLNDVQIPDNLAADFTKECTELTFLGARVQDDDIRLQVSRFSVACQAMVQSDTPTGAEKMRMTLPDLLAEVNLSVGAALRRLDATFPALRSNATSPLPTTKTGPG